MPDRYEPAIIEPKWQQRWREADLFRTGEDPNRPKFYCLDFFPYPSGSGLSVGHLKNYIPTDVLSRKKVMEGFNVLHPMGWDAFGLPAETAAIREKRHPADLIREYAETYKRQQNLVGIGYDWSREISSSDPEFYKWTQWIFLILFKRGLAYQGEFPANWCPVDKTVLANEEVEGGRCWRCGNPVEKKMLKQWFFKITEYAQRLLDDLDEIEWPEGIKAMQRNWIGRSEGVEFRWNVVGTDKSFTVFTTRIDTVFGATFCVLSPEHPLVSEIVTEEHRESVEQYVLEASRLNEQDRLAVGREKTGVFSGAYAENPFSGEKAPVWIADYVLMGYGTGAIMAVPGHDERDFEFAKKFGLEIRQVIEPLDGVERALPFEATDGRMVNSGEFDGLTCAEGQSRLADVIESRGIGARRVNYRLRDWLVSRQRYWGCPIPVVHTADGEIEAVPESELPVLLPPVESYEPTETGESPLAAIEEFVQTNDSRGRPARRETDTMSGFACSSWYFLRFCDPRNSERAWDPKKVEYWMPVDCYVGGAEHAVLHLLYARFWTKVLYDEGLVPFKEPFSVLRNQGMLLAQTPFRKPREGETLHVGEEGVQISFEEAAQLPPDQVFYRWEKMSKSKGNVVTPEEAVSRYGADALRVYELFEAPFEQTIQWTDERVIGAVRFVNRVFKVSDSLRKYFIRNWRSGVTSAQFDRSESALRFSTHCAIEKVSKDIDDFRFNTAVAALMEFVNSISDFARTADFNRESARLAASEAIENLLLLIAPVAPHTADEVWESYGLEGFTLNKTWPKADPSLMKMDEVTVVLQVNGKVRANIQAPASSTQEDLERLALENEKVRQHIGDLAVRKVIVVPGKLVNVVVG